MRALASSSQHRRPLLADHCSTRPSAAATGLKCALFSVATTAVCLSERNRSSAAHCSIHSEPSLTLLRFKVLSAFICFKMSVCGGGSEKHLAPFYRYVYILDPSFGNRALNGWNSCIVFVPGFFQQFSWCLLLSSLNICQILVLSTFAFLHLSLTSLALAELASALRDGGCPSKPLPGTTFLGSDT